MQVDLTDEEVKFLKGFFGKGTYAESPDDDVVFQSIQEKLGNKSNGLFLWTVVFRADRVDTIGEMERILGDASSSDIIGVDSHNL